MNFCQLWQNRQYPSISFELFPARDDKSAKKLIKVIDSLLEVGPDFVSVTFGAGGLTREGSYELVKELKSRKGVTVLPYLAAYGLSPEEIGTVIDRYVDLGIDSLFCVRGDEPHEEEGEPAFTPNPNSFRHASDFLTYVNGKYQLCTGAAGYPEGHIAAESKEKDLEYLKLKVEKGARFIIAQYVYDNRYFFEFCKRCREIGIQVPILAGVMPIYSVKMTENLAKMCGSKITQEVKDAFSRIPADDKDAVTEFGVSFALEQCRGLLKQGVDGIHFYTMDRSNTVTRIISQLRSEKLLA